LFLKLLNQFHLQFDRDNVSQTIVLDFRQTISLVAPFLQV